MEKLDDIKSLIFEGCLKQTIRFKDFFVVIRTLSPAEEVFVIDTYKDLPSDYNLMAAIDTIQRVIYSINGCKITDEYRHKIQDWPRAIIIKIFNQYLKLVVRAKDSVKHINDFIKTDDSRLRWSVLKTTKSSINSAVITGNSEFESRGLSYVQQIWIYLNQQDDLVEQNKREWTKVEYMTDSICTFVNPKAMKQIQGKKKLEQEQQLINEQQKELIQIQKDSNSKEKVMIENKADELFDSLTRKTGESALEYNNRVKSSVIQAFAEDEHDKIVREHEESMFIKELRIKKENSRRAKILHQKKLSNAIVINMPAPVGIQVGFNQSVTMGDDERFEAIEQEEIKNNIYYINGVDYSDIISIVSFNMLKNRDKILNEIANESGEVTTSYINQYIDEDNQQQSDITKTLQAIKSGNVTEGKSDILSMREQILSGGKINRHESQQQDLIAQIKKEQEDSDEIHIGR